MTEVQIFTFCSTFTCEINNGIDSTLCGTKDCLYKTYSKITCHLIIDNLNYCKHCVAVSKTLYTTDGIDADWFERI